MVGRRGDVGEERVQTAERDGCQSGAMYIMSETMCGRLLRRGGGR